MQTKCSDHMTFIRVACSDMHHLELPEGGAPHTPLQQGHMINGDGHQLQSYLLNCEMLQKALERISKWICS